MYIVKKYLQVFTIKIYIIYTVFDELHTLPVITFNAKCTTVKLIK